MAGKMSTPEMVASILAKPDPDYGYVVAFLLAEVHSRRSGGESITLVGDALIQCLPDQTDMARVLAVTLGNLLSQDKGAR